MVVAVGAGERYVIPTISILESLRPVREQLSIVVGKGEMLSIRGELMPLFRLHRLFDIPDAKDNPCEALVLVIGENGKRCALMVDNLLGQQQAVIKPLGETFDGLEGISGGAIMGDGRVALILDTGGLVHMATGSSRK